MSSSTDKDELEAWLKEKVYTCMSVLDVDPTIDYEIEVTATLNRMKAFNEVLKYLKDLKERSL